MEKDKLEKYISENREAFDIHELPDNIWPRIYDQLPDKRKRRFNILKLAAVGLVLLAVGIGIGNQMHSNEPIRLADIAPPEFIETENYYAQQVANSYKELKAIGGDKHIDADLQALDEVYKELKNELLYSQVKNKEIILDAMIKNYQTKADLMQMILERLQEKENYIDPKNNENEKVEI